MKKIGTTCALALALSLTFGTTALVAGQASPKPAAKVIAKHPWASFNVGSWVKMKSTTVMEIAGTKNTSVLETKMTMLEKTAEKVVIETEMTVMGQTTKTRADLPLKASAGRAAAAQPASVPKTGSDTITIAGKPLSCKTMEIETDAGGMKILSKTWTSEQVPGSLVKSVSTTQNSQTTTEVVDFKAL
ncbi:MAG: hypothetical protein ABSH05_23640 [Bryobacteraceae bacterium]|jgi:hypothetical protein